MDRFVMEHVLPDDRRVATVLALLRLGYADRPASPDVAASDRRGHGGEVRPVGG